MPLLLYKLKLLVNKEGIFMAKNFIKLFTIWSIGAITYGAIEIISRGNTHISMGILGGICLLSIDRINH